MKLIGITGNKGAGKDTVANMLSYISEGYDYRLYDKNNDYTIKSNILHFGDAVKNICSIIYGIDVNDFYDRDKKDNLWYSIIKKKYYTEEEVLINAYNKINSIAFNNSEAGLLVDTIAYQSYILKNNNSVVKLRTIMQFIGTDVFQKIFSKYIWIDTTFTNIKDKVLNIIADVRFKLEVNRIKVTNGIIIKIKNTSYPSIKTSHISEQEIEDLDCEYIVEWDGNDKLDLFNKLKKIYETVF